MGCKRHLIKALEESGARSSYNCVGSRGEGMEGQGGKYLDDCVIARPHDPSKGDYTLGYAPWAYDRDGASRLWTTTLGMLHLDAE